ncbi:hypothetical protein Tco_1109315 [Tanacetum coccineum]
MSSLYFIVNRFGSMIPLVKPLEIRNFESSSYQALGACFYPYRASLRRMSVGEEDLLTREVPSLKNSLYNRDQKRRSNSCCDGIVGTRPEVSLATDVSDISLISSNLSDGVNLQPCSLVHAVANASAQKNKGSLEADNIHRAASTRVRFRLLTMPLCSGVRGVEV